MKVFFGFIFYEYCIMLVQKTYRKLIKQCVKYFFDLIHSENDSHYRSGQAFEL